jgi:hypothetical protein
MLDNPTTGLPGVPLNRDVMASDGIIARIFPKVKKFFPVSFTVFLVSDNRTET